MMSTWVNFGAKPPLDAFLVDILQTACTATRLNQGIGGWFLPHLADSAQVAFFLVRILQQQPTAGQEETVIIFTHSLMSKFRVISVSNEYSTQNVLEIQVSFWVSWADTEQLSKKATQHQLRSTPAAAFNSPECCWWKEILCTSCALVLRWHNSNFAQHCLEEMLRILTTSSYYQ